MSDGVHCGLVGRVARANSARSAWSSSVATANGALASAHVCGALYRHKSSFSDLKSLKLDCPPSSTRDAPPSTASASHSGRQPSLAHRVTCLMALGISVLFMRNAFDRRAGTSQINDAASHFTECGDPAIWRCSGQSF